MIVRNGDAHLKNFGLLYDDPANTGLMRLVPLFDVLKTAAYGHENQRTGRNQVIERIAQAMHETLYEHRNLFPQAIVQRLSDEWDAGRSFLRPSENLMWP